MSALTEALNRLEHLLNQTSPVLAMRLQPGLTRTAIDEKSQDFSWRFSEEIYELYQWHNGLSDEIGTTNLSDKSLRQKDQWHYRLSGQDNQINLKYKGHLITAKFPPLEYALGGYSHIKLGKCPFALLPISILSDGKSQSYCLINLGEKQSALYFVNGAGVPPNKIDEMFLSTQIKFSSLTSLILLITDCCEGAVQSVNHSQEEAGNQEFNPISFEVDENVVEQIYRNFLAQ